MRKSNYFGLWLLLVLSLSIMVLVSFSDDIKVGEWTVKKAPVKESLFPQLHNREKELIRQRLDSMNAAMAQEALEQPIDSAPQSILLIGDSMTMNLALRLAQYAKVAGHQFHAVNWDSSNTKIWAESDTLRHYIREYDATFIFISLGANELYLTHPEGHRKYVEEILTKIGKIPYVWIGPPNWSKDAGLNDMIQATCAPGAFFRSEGMEFRRKKDGVHPTRESSALWIDSVVRWIPSSAHPILFESLPDSIGKVNNNIIFLKPKR